MRLLSITSRAPFDHASHIPSSGIKRTWDEPEPSLLAQKLKMANGRKTLPCAAWDVPTWFCWVLCVFQELKQSIEHCNKTGYYECSTRNTKRYITKGKFYRDYFYFSFLLFLHKWKLIYPLIYMTRVEVTYSEQNSQKAFCFQWTSLIRAKVIPWGVGAAGDWLPYGR